MLMRKLFLLLACLFSVAIYAGHISEQEALQKARQFMHDKQFATTGVDNTRRAASASQPETNSGYYIFNAKNNGGFVIVSADDRMPEILGYSNHGSIDIETAYGRLSQQLMALASLDQQQVWRTLKYGFQHIFQPKTKSLI